MGQPLTLDEVEVAPTRATAWNLGDSLFWRTPEGGVNAVVLTKEASPRSPGVLTSIECPSLEALNDALHELGFESTDLTYDEIKIVVERTAKPWAKPHHRSRNFTLVQISASHKAALDRRRKANPA